MEFFDEIKDVSSHSIHKHDTTLKMAFGANFFLAEMLNGPPTLSKSKWVQECGNWKPLLQLGAAVGMLMGGQRMQQQAIDWQEEAAKVILRLEQAEQEDSS